MMVTDFILCEDIRHEMSNKVSLIGIFNDGIILNPPTESSALADHASIRLSFYVRIKLEAGEMPDSFELVGRDNDGEIARFSGTIQYRSPSQVIALSLSSAQFPIPTKGILIFELDLKSGSETVHRGSYPYPVKVSVQEKTVAR